MENPCGLLIPFMEPMEPKGPKGKEPNEPTHSAQVSASASAVGVGGSRFDHEINKRYAADTANCSIGGNGEHITLGSGWVFTIEILTLLCMNTR
jgi:hypothetical protein